MARAERAANRHYVPKILFAEIADRKAASSYLISGLRLTPDNIRSRWCEEFQ
jgi:hypothetical protein